MYRIELAPGEETVFRTIEELAIGVRNGLVTPRCRIYHNASQKWLPIEFHPHYKKALALPASRVAEAVAPKPAGRPRIDTVSFAVKPPVTRPDSAPIAEPTAEAQTAAPKPTGTEPPERQIRKRLPIGRAQAMGPRVELPEPSAAPHRVGELRTSEQPATEPLIAEQPKAVQPSAEPPTTVQTVAGHPPVDPELSHSDRQAADHPVREITGQGHRAQGHRALEPRAHEHHSLQLSAADQLSPEDATAEHPVAEHPVASKPSPVSEVRDHFVAGGEVAPRPQLASPAPTLHEPPPQPHPVPAPRARSSYRPDSYLPPSVRLVSDDPFVAIAPEAAIAPDAATETRGAIRPSAPVPWRSPVEAVAPELQSISYPEITPADEPVPERAGTSRGRRPLQVAVAVLVLAAGGYLAKSFYSPVRGNGSAPAAARVDRPALPGDGATPSTAAQAAAPTETTTGSVTRGPSAVITPLSGPAAAVAPPAPASSGFAAALEPRAMASGPAPKLPNAGAGVTSAASTRDSTVIPAPIAPAPDQMQMDVPALAGGVPLMPSASSRDDSAMKRILRAVGGKDAKQP